MAELVVFLSLLAVVVVFLIVKLMRRGSSRTQNADGLRIEEARREQAHDDRMSYNSLAVHQYPLTHNKDPFHP
ncbi:hypothetical protein [Streptomyces sp. NPDC026673]|uniref:hypothetical protein n=1 Tax=Streptomyces sp. NPDC026673 TaxID=3155724 RepID=UPI0033FE4F79